MLRTQLRNRSPLDESVGVEPVDGSCEFGRQHGFGAPREGPLG
jgi:hypothetical protein